MTEEMRERAEFRQRWHEAINRFTLNLIGREGWPSFMYEAKNVESESQRLRLLFQREREGKLAKAHVQCATIGTPPVDMPDNHLTCCLGVECRKCEFLLALESEHARALTPEQQDEAKAWTCVSHILSQGGDAAGEGYILTEDDKLYWSNVYASLGAGAQ